MAHQTIANLLYISVFLAVAVALSVFFGVFLTSHNKQTKMIAAAVVLICTTYAGLFFYNLYDISYYVRYDDNPQNLIKDFAGAKKYIIEYGDNIKSVSDISEIIKYRAGEQNQYTPKDLSDAESKIKICITLLKNSSKVKNNMEQYMEKHADEPDIITTDYVL